MSARTALRILSIIYPKSRFCMKQHKRLDFRVFPDRLRERLKKETVNLSVKKANLCFGLPRTPNAHGVFQSSFPLWTFSLITVAQVFSCETDSIGCH